MQSPDVNVLVNAFRQDTTHHDRCRAWLDAAVSSREPVGVSELVLSGVLRILTHPRIFHPPTSVASAATFIDAVLAQPSVTPLRPGSGHWRIFRGLIADHHPPGNRISDAYHAALAMEHGCEWVTLDHDFSIYPSLRCVNLLVG
ncbi:MAG: type II toxin-antitoxin system VapC family toxin [Acidobacteriia bacterium]|nr:type II toxin-antitoxin system VapC family toxin [Terriglobia bacterium]